MAFGDRVSGTFASHRLHRRCWPERNLNVELEEKVETPPPPPPLPPHTHTHPRSPLESSVRDFGDPNPCCAQLFQP